MDFTIGYFEFGCLYDCYLVGFTKYSLQRCINGKSRENHGYIGLGAIIQSILTMTRMTLHNRQIAEFFSVTRRLELAGH